MKKLILTFCCFFLMGIGTPSYAAVEKTSIELLTLPFGTSSYAADMALESLFKELKSPVTLLLKQTPGALFIARYHAENTENMKQGKVPFVSYLMSTPIIPYMGNGLPPYQDYPLPNMRAYAALGAVLLPFVTFNPKIKTPADFAGKKVGFGEKARPNMSTLPNKPIFDKAYGGFDKVNWQYLGFSNSKDAILNGSIDVHMGNMNCKLEQAEDGTYFTTKVTPDPALMEVISANKPFFFISEDPEILKTAYDPKTDQVYFPVLVKAGTIAGVNEDFWVKGAATAACTDANLSDEVVEEMVYTIFKNRERLAEYYDGFVYLPNSPYIDALPMEWWHPGVFKAMKRLGLELPAGVTVE